jgi:hypothetical protein
MDNESFRFLAAVKQGIHFTSNNQGLFDDSWRKAKEETFRMLSYISALDPHKVIDSITINDTRRKILDLTKPLAEIARLIEVTIAVLEDKKEEIETIEKTAEEIKATICIQIPTLERKDLDHPRTVCTSPKCSESCILDGQYMKNFSTFCHEHCHLRGVATDIINTPELKSCWAMSPSGGQSCRICQCGWEVHMHVTYDLVPVTKSGEDVIAMAKFENITDVAQMKHAAVTELQAKIQELSAERQKILEGTAQFGFFLKKNSLLVYNDAMLAYLDYIVKQEKEKAAASRDFTKVEAMLDLRSCYEEQIEILKNAPSLENNETLSSESQEKIIDELCSLKHYGQHLSDIFQGLVVQRMAKVHQEEEYQDQKKGSLRNIVARGIAKLSQYIGGIWPFSSYKDGANQIPMSPSA